MTIDSPPQVAENNAGMGWVYNYETGDIIANTDDLDDEGIGYDGY